MMNVDFSVTVRNKNAQYMGDLPYVCGNSDYRVLFDFDEEWDALETKTARFLKEDGTYRDQVFTGTICPVPVIENTYWIKVGVFAGNLHTTTPAHIPAKKSILCASGMPSAPSDDVYAQIIQKIDAGLLKGEKGDKGDTGEQGPQGEPGKDAEVDATLSVSGAAADAAKVGTRLNSYAQAMGVLNSTIAGKQDKGDYALRSELYAPILPYAGTLSANTVYTAELSGNVAFSLPDVTDIAHENRIRMLARIAADAVIDWGTVTYYGAAKPFINEGVYEILWDYNPLIGAWVVGVTRIGQVSAG